jgi:hypothetical protein
MSANLTDTQQLLLRVAAKRGDRCLVLPSTLKGGAAHKVAAKLIAAGLVKEIRAKAELPAWRRDEGTGLAYSLKLTAAGAKAIANDEVAVANELQEASGAREQAVAAAPAASAGSEGEAANPGAPASVVSPRGGTKIALVVGLIQRSVGATLDELVASTGWLPHTTRAALTGLRRRGYAVSIDRSDKTRGSTYRIAADAGFDAAAAAAVEPATGKSARRSQEIKRAVARQARKAA